jgi:hypothetical protein
MQNSDAAFMKALRKKSRGTLKRLNNALARSLAQCPTAASGPIPGAVFTSRMLQTGEAAITTLRQLSDHFPALPCVELSRQYTFKTELELLLHSMPFFIASGMLLDDIVKAGTLTRVESLAAADVIAYGASLTAYLDRCAKAAEEFSAWTTSPETKEAARVLTESSRTMLTDFAASIRRAAAAIGLTPDCEYLKSLPPA